MFRKSTVNLDKGSKVSILFENFHLFVLHVQSKLKGHKNTSTYLKFDQELRKPVTFHWKRPCNAWIRYLCPFPLKASLIDILIPCVAIPVTVLYSS